ncbi:MAG TPA: TetR/AcrR family transcriptional regulator [Clostridia bacterium]|nr:TetR/AcrR family transcriptional regulator [Clostridia bacterium]
MIEQKNSVKQRILDAAVQEFLVSGYQHTSMRTIAAQAGMTVGNVYLYFSGKEALFKALLDPVLLEVERLIQYKRGDDQAITPEAFAEFPKELCEIFLEHRHSFLILLDGSAGSPYEHYREHLRLSARLRIQEALATLDPCSATDEPLMDAVTTALIEGLLRIFTQHAQDSEALQSLLQRFLICVLGVLFPNIPKS